MGSDIYIGLLNNPPKIEIKKGVREVIFQTRSCMCDNTGIIRFKKNDEGEFKLNCGGQSFGNFQTGYREYELEWEADEEQWGIVRTMIDKGTSKVESVRSR
tara:strand:- start:183 stop:485 length:303 start_codon:yes stop_codon:yes gene_type:complete